MILSCHFKLSSDVPLTLTATSLKFLDITIDSNLDVGFSVNPNFNRFTRKILKFLDVKIISAFLKQTKFKLNIFILTVLDPFDDDVLLCANTSIFINYCLVMMGVCLIGIPK